MAELTTASLFAGEPIDCVVRLSNGGSSPYLPDREGPKRGNTLGMGVRFALPSGDFSTWSALEHAGVPAAHAGRLQRDGVRAARGAAGRAAQPAAAARVPRAAPVCGRGDQGRGDAPAAAELRDVPLQRLPCVLPRRADGHRQAFRFRWLPLAGEEALDPADHVDTPPQYLVSEIKQRVARAPVAWRLVFQLAAPGDPTDDLTRLWPEDRELLDAGQLVIDRLHEDPDEVDGWVFDPTRMPPGIALSDDPLLHFRSEAYAESHRRRTREQRPAILPE